jgi:hypothetical protein
MRVHHACIPWLLCAGLTFNAAAQDATVLTLNREHVGNDCVVGPVTSGRDVFAWAVEKPWKENPPVWGGLLPGTYTAKATFRKGTGIELAFSDLPDQPTSLLTLGARTENGTGRVAIGSDMAGNCRVESGKSYSAVAKRLAERVFGTSQPVDGQSAVLRVRVADR